MAVRKDLQQSELDALPATWRDQLRNPSLYFDKEFTDAWLHADSGKCIDLLASEYSASLLIRPPVVLDRRTSLAKIADGELEESIKAELFKYLSGEAKRFLFPSPVYELEAKAA